MATYEIPLSPEAQIFSVTLAGKSFQFSLSWNQFSLLWILDILDSSNSPIVRGIPLVANTDLLEPYEYLDFGGKLVAQTDGEADVSPTYSNLGILGRLYFITS